MKLVPEKLSARYRRWRNAVLMDAGFRRRALANPVGRFVGRRAADDSLALLAGFVHSQMLSAAVQLDLLAKLDAGPERAERLAETCAIPVSSMTILLRSLAPIGVSEPYASGRYGLGKVGATIISDPGILAMIGHHDAFYRDLADPVALLRGESGRSHLSQLWNYEACDGDGAGEAQRYSTLMAASQTLIAQTVLRRFDVSAYRRIADLGGGFGAFLFALRTRNDSAELLLMDRQAVIDSGPWEKWDAARIRPLAGDFHQGGLPERCDLVTLIRVLHDHDDGPALDLLKRIRAAIAPGGTVLIAEPMSLPGAGSRLSDGYLGPYLLAMGQGRPRRPETIRAMLSEAGFASSHFLPTGMPVAADIVTGAAPG